MENEVDENNILVDEQNDEIVVTPEESLEDLKKQIADERALREEAEKKALEASASAQKSEEKALTAQDVAVQNAEERLALALGSAEERIESLQKKYKEAYESGDADQLLKTTDELMEAKLDLRQLKANKVGFDKYKENLKNQPKPQQQDDGISDKSKEWIKEHPEFNTNKTFRARAISAHYEAEAEGIALDSDEYFEFIEGRLGLKDKTNTDVKTQDRSPGGAPPSRGPAISKGSNGGGRFIKLTPAQKEAAEICGMTEVEYAKSLQEGNA